MSEQPACIDIDSSRMACTGTPADSPFREAASFEPNKIFALPL